ncbi:MAG: hemolysin family protein [Candidatus Margulisbacteria bacterium]|nr:hemolysin family protein [Candidatus Margulisiibacteriota bacterium]MBU1021422.1 hemolysin family protein [Candidatus Margulisiibacteriota bacterium]MBU1728343.1 hemolysin family protein [Candidatus Margulisiibacteriota bacterium]MBU1955914.1 hemolysin family protein [Candidatus Margulisiibacteriota bacterium]
MNFSIDFLLLVVLILLSGFMSASETALTTVSRIKIRKLVDQKVSGAKAIQVLRESPAKMLSTILIANNLVNIWASVLAASIVIRYFEGRGWANLSFAVGIATGFMTFFLLVFGEITPKTIAIRRAQKVALLVSGPILVLQWILQPVAWLLTSICRPLVYSLGGRAPEKGPILTEDEIKMILSVGQKEGVIEEGERRMISSIFEFGDTTVREVMTPRPDVHCVEKGAGIEKAIEVVKKEGHSRIPVYEGNLDNVVGLIFAKDLLGAEKDRELKDYMRPVIFIPESKKIDDLLHQMQAARTHMAIAVDEFGTTSGIVTLEDLIEEIVGEIHDEFEKGEKDYEKLGKSIYLVKGSTTISDLNDLMGISLPEKEKEYDTIGGFVFGELGKVPAVGDIVRFEDVLISVERVHRRRITLVKVTKGGADADESRYVGG